MAETEFYVLHVNGSPHEVADAWVGESLLYVLRERLGLLGSKGACEQGECGSCSVLIDDELVCSCLVLAASAVGQAIVTIEGIAPHGSPSDVQRAFVECGADPVWVLHARPDHGRAFAAGAHASADRYRDPRRALRQHLPLHGLRTHHRGRAARRRVAIDRAMSATTTREATIRGRLGDSPPRPDGMTKAQGAFAFAGDLSADGFLWGATLRSPHPHARIRSHRPVGGVEDQRGGSDHHRRRRARQAHVRIDQQRPAGLRRRRGPLRR